LPQRASTTTTQLRFPAVRLTSSRRSRDARQTSVADGRVSNRCLIVLAGTRLWDAERSMHRFPRGVAALRSLRGSSRDKRKQEQGHVACGAPSRKRINRRFLRSPWPACSW